MNAMRFARTIGNAVLVILFCFALFVSVRRAMHAWNAGTSGETLFWALVVLGAVSLTVRAIRRTLHGARAER